jgi:protein-tyrosine phosphatase
MSTYPAVTSWTEGRPWGLALLWFLVLGPLLFYSDGFAVNRAASYAHATLIHGSSIPILQMLNLSIRVLCGVSIFVASSRGELNRHGLRLLLAIACFCAFSLAGINELSNASQGLQTSLLVLLWLFCAGHTPMSWRRVLDGGFLCVALTAFFPGPQHGIGLPTGVFLGAGLRYLVPEEPHRWTWIKRLSPGARRIATAYGTSAMLCLMGALRGGAHLWWLWGALAFSLVALGYLGAGSSIFRKQPDGQHPLHAWVLMAPYLVIARFSHWRISRRLPERSSAVGDIVLRCRPQKVYPGECVVDLCAEMPSRRNVEYRYVSVPMMDLVAPPLEQLTAAVEAIRMLQQFGKVHVNCALGVGRSAVVGAAWLLDSGLVNSVEAAMAQVRAQRPGVKFAGGTAQLLATWLESRGK